MGLIEKEQASRIIQDIEPKIIGRSDPASEELAILRLVIKLTVLINSFPVARLRDNLAKSGLKFSGLPNIGRMSRCEHILEHDLGNTRSKRIFRVRIFCPIPVRKHKTRIAAEFQADLLKPSYIAAMPNQKPPVAVWAVHRVR